MEKWDTPKELDRNLIGEIDVNRALEGCIVSYLYVKLKSYVSPPVLPKEEKKT